MKVGDKRVVETVENAVADAQMYRPDNPCQNRTEKRKEKSSVETTCMKRKKEMSVQQTNMRNLFVMILRPTERN